MTSKILKIGLNLNCSFHCVPIKQLHTTIKTKNVITIVVSFPGLGTRLAELLLNNFAILIALR